MPSTNRGMHYAQNERGGGILALTIRAPVRERIVAISLQLNLRRPAFVDRVGGVTSAGPHHAVLLLDLGSCAESDGLELLAQSWAAANLGTELVVLLPLINRDFELQTAMGLVAAARNAPTRVMTSSDFERDEVWHNLRVSSERSVLSAELRSEFLAAVGVRTIRARPVVLGILDGATATTGMQATARAAMPTARAKADTPRKTMWRVLHASGQMPASWLLVIFRVLWYTKLNEKGWSAGRISDFLGFPSPRHLRLTVKRRSGVSMEQLKIVRNADALAWAAALVTSDHATQQAMGGMAIRELIGPLLR